MKKQQPQQYPTTVQVNYNPETGKGHYVALPRIWLDEFLSTELPGTFWKYILHLWRWLSIPRPDGSGYDTAIRLGDFPVNSDASVQWTAAFAVCGFVTVKLGKWKHAATKFTYRATATPDEWRCFLRALVRCAGVFKQYRNNVGGWRVCVAGAVDAERVAAGLPPANVQWLEKALLQTDAAGRPIAQRQEDGSIVGLVYPPPVRHKPTAEEMAWGPAFPEGTYDPETGVY